jgi:hypothetical protein
MKVVLHTVGLAVFVLVSHAAGQDKTPPDKSKDKPNSGAAAYDHFPEPLRSKLVKEWEQELDALKRAITDDEKRLQLAKTVKERQHFETLIYAYKGKLAMHEKNEPPYFTKERAQTLGGAGAKDKTLLQLSVTTIKVGENYTTDGGLPNGARSNNTWGKILQVIDDDNMLVGIDNGRADNNSRYFVTVWCKASTEGLTDGKTDFLGNILGTRQVKVTDTTTYQTADGATKTVFVVERITQKELEEMEAKERETAEAAQSREWTIREDVFVGKLIEFKNNLVRLERKDDQKIVEVPLKDLTTDDQKWVREELKRRAEEKRKAATRKLKGR